MNTLYLSQTEEQATKKFKKLAALVLDMRDGYEIRHSSRLIQHYNKGNWYFMSVESPGMLRGHNFDRVIIEQPIDAGDIFNQVLNPALRDSRFRS